MDQQSTQTGVSRRDLLKRGAALGGTIAWMTPVVQTIGMAPAMAQVPSEGTCCLRVELSASKANSDDIVINWTVRNCGPNTDFNVRTFVEENVNSGASWVQVDFANFASLTAGSSNSQSLLREGLNPGEYRYRIYGLYDCLDATDIRHNVPGSEYLIVGPVVI